MVRSIISVLAFALALAAPAAAQPIVGVASVIDGDTVDVHGTRIRIEAIDAPESRQLCKDASGADYRCGQVAAFALADFLEAHRPVSCIEVDRDRYGRSVSVCTAGGIDIAEWMVSQGHAIDYTQYSGGAYVAAESEARAAKRGIWAGSFQKPWEWRRDRRNGS